MFDRTKRLRRGAAIGAVLLGASTFLSACGGNDNDQNSLEPAQSIPGYFDRPDDDPDGGILSFGFHGTVEPRSLDLVGIDVARNQLARVTLFDRAGRTRVYSVPAGWTGQGTPSVRTLDLTTLAPQAGFAGSATAIQTAGFEPRAVTDIEVELGSSGALDDLCWDPHPD